MADSQQYWIVGATLSGLSAVKTFVRRGYWELGASSKPKRDALYMERLSKVKVGDRIALKSLVGKGSALIKVHAIGVVEEVIISERRVYVHWKSTEMARDVDMNGCMDAINSPYLLDGKSKEWVKDIFRI